MDVESYPDRHSALTPSSRLAGLHGKQWWQQAVFWLFLGLMCGLSARVLPLYQQSQKEVTAKEEKLRKLRSEHERLRRELAYLSTEEGKEAVALRHGWIPPGSRVILLPPPETGVTAKGRCEAPPSDSGLLEDLAERVVNAYKHCRGHLAKWWDGFHSQE